MPQKTYTTTPSDYAVCIHADCPMAASCLHQKVYPKMMEEYTILRLVNPGKCSKDSQCEYYRDSKPVTYARGFLNFQKKMFPEQYQRFMISLIGKFGRNGYFERRRGARVLPPKEQEIVKDALLKVGVTEELKFDAYEELLNWYD
ncbi:MAG: DUF6078 family protein [Prevotella sp.]|nr:DUF6078 family protein [Prevotella sp.]